MVSRVWPGVVRIAATGKGGNAGGASSGPEVFEVDLARTSPASCLTTSPDLR